MSSLKSYFESNPGLPIDKWTHYFPIYEKHFTRFVNANPTVIEIGVGGGGSLQMWADYFGPGSRIIGFDCDESCRRFARNGIEVVIGDQGDIQDLRKLAQVAGSPNLILDDGGHKMFQQRVAFQMLFPLLPDGGIYLIEDLHTSYWPEYGGGFRRAGTFVEFVKSMIDDMNGWHHRADGTGINMYSQTVNCVSCYDSLVVIDKATITRPTQCRSGVEPIETNFQ